MREEGGEEGREGGGREEGGGGEEEREEGGRRRGDEGEIKWWRYEEEGREGGNVHKVQGIVQLFTARKPSALMSSSLFSLLSWSSSNILKQTGEIKIY